eukprot:g4701.t1
MYDALDKRNYKQAIKIANKAKRPTDILIVLKAHACERLGKFEEALDICLGVKKRLIPEEYLVNHLTMVFNNLGYPKHATESVAKACESLKKSSPLLENFLKQLFFCHGKERQYLLQQQTAMKLYRQYKKPEYALWVATTMVLQIDNNTGNANMLMKMATRFLKTALETLPERGGQASELYLNILSRDGQYQEAITCLKSLVSENSGRLKSSSMLPVEVKKLEAKFYKELNNLSMEEQIARQILHEINADDWDAYTSLIGICKRYLVDYTKDKASETDHVVMSATAVKEKVNSIYLFLEELSNNEEHKGRLRGPMLGLIAFEYEIRKMNMQERHGNVNKWCLVDEDGYGVSDGSKLLRYIKGYVALFGSKNCCFKDLKQYLLPFVCENSSKVHGAVLIEASKSVKDEFIQFLKATINQTNDKIRLHLNNKGASSEDDMAEKRHLKKELQKYIFSMQTLLYVDYDFHDFGEDVASILVRQWKDTLPLNEGVSGGQREVQCGDTLLILASQVLHNRLTVSPSANTIGKKQFNINAQMINILSILHYGLKHSMYNFHFKLFMLHLYERLCCFDDAMDVYKSLSVKYIQLDTLSYLIFDNALNSCACTILKDECNKILTFHKNQDRQIDDAMQTAYLHNNAMQVFEFTKFRNKMKKSNRRLRSAIETTYNILLNKNPETPISSSIAAMNKIFEEIGGKDAELQNKAKKKLDGLIVLEVLSKIDFSVFNELSFTDDNSILTPFNFHEEDGRRMGILQKKNSMKMKVMFLHVKMFFSLCNLDLDQFDKMKSQFAENDSGEQDNIKLVEQHDAGGDDIPYNVVLIDTFNLVRQMLDLPKNSVVAGDAEASVCIDMIKRLDCTLKDFFGKVNSDWSFECGDIYDMYTHPNVVRTLSYFFGKGLPMMFCAFYAVVTKAGNLNVLKKQKKKKKGKKKVGNKNGNGAASDSENLPKLLSPMRKLLQTMSVGCADSVNMINRKLDFQKHELDMKNIEASFGIQKDNAKVDDLLGDDAGYKLCRQEVFQKVYESHRHTFERLLREATACSAMGKEILSVLK